MLPHSEPQLSDVVRDWKLETEVHSTYIKHIDYENGLSARERHVRREHKWKRERLLGKGGYGAVYLEKMYTGYQARRAEGRQGDQEAKISIIRGNSRP
jgi:calcium/calmodulin-dependent protein kinase I